MKFLKSVYFFFLMIVAGNVHALTLTDIAGRQVTIKQPVNKVVLGEGRFLAAFGVLGVKQPITKVVGMMDEFRRFDPDGFKRYQQAFPDIDSVSTFGLTSEQSVNLEKIILLQPDVAIFGLQGHGPGARSKFIIDALSAAGIPIVFIDFRQQPLVNTTKSIEILGEILGYQQRAREFTTFYNQNVDKIVNRLSKVDSQQCPSVFIELRVDADNECCLTVAKGMFADMIDAAGGCNIAKNILPGAVGQLSQEYLIKSDPDIYIGTAMGHVGELSSKSISSNIVLGPGVNVDLARTTLLQASSRPGFRDLTSVKNSRTHALWHHFYNSPLNLYAFQKIAQWIHPELFNDLDPEVVLAEMLSHSKPVNLDGIYAISIQ